MEIIPYYRITAENIENTKDKYFEQTTGKKANTSLKLNKYLYWGQSNEIPVLNFRTGYLFNWDCVPGKESERLKGFLCDDLDLNWVKNEPIYKPDNKTICIYKDKNLVEIKIDEKNKKPTLIINRNRPKNLYSINENGNLNIYKYNKTINLKEDHFNKIVDMEQYLTTDQYNFLKEQKNSLPNITTFDLTTRTRLIINHGSESILENSIALHPYYGFPVIPGSAIKGITMNYCVEIEEFNNNLMKQIFGNPLNDNDSIKGCIIFLDAWPESINAGYLFTWEDNISEKDKNRLKEFLVSNFFNIINIKWVINAKIKKSDDAICIIDNLRSSNNIEISLDKDKKFATILLNDNQKYYLKVVNKNGSIKIYHDKFLETDVFTPHYQEYYKKNQLPKDDQSLIPVNFLAVKKDIKFEFAIAPTSNGSNEEINTLLKHTKSLIEKALKYCGIGAKTGSNYGYFK